NRNFEGRISPHVKSNYLASPPLVVAYAIAGSMHIDLTKEPIGQDKNGKDVYLKDIWPSNKEIAETVNKCLSSDMFTQRYADVFKGPKEWQAIGGDASGQTYKWQGASTYVKNPPFFDGIAKKPGETTDITGAYALAILGDSVTTDHISPAGSIKKDSPAGIYLSTHGVKPVDFNSYGSRRGNHEVMMRGTFANIRIRNEMVPGKEGGFTKHIPSDETMSIYDAAMKYQAEGTPLVVIAGKEYGTGSSRDWAAKGTLLLGVKIVIAESFERIHRSNLVGMGVLPCGFVDGQNAASLGLNGTETFDFEGIGDGTGKTLKVTATGTDGSVKQFEVRVMLDTPKEVEYYRHGGILPYVLRELAKSPDPAAAKAA
ncbi:MAG: aconitate hydratase, partial [Xanthomonadales bacterium]|nr:aconitate hydratase [Xanthomonadales bacterium]